MRVAVTGGAGFIGEYVIEDLQARGIDPVLFDRRYHADYPGVAVFHGDVRDATAVNELAAHVDGIIHLAAVLGTQETIANPLPSVETNVVGSLNVFEAAAQYDLPVVYIGVGNHRMTSSGGGAYVQTKTCAEHFTSMYRLHRGLRVNVVRAMNAYGPGQSVAAPFGSSKVRKITPAFICRALSGLPIEVYGDGEQVSDMVYVADVAKALVSAFTAAERGDVFDRPVEVGPAVSRTVNDVAALVAELVADRGRRKVDIVHLPMRPGENPAIPVNADTASLALVGMDAEELVSLPVGLTRTIDFYVDSEGEGWKAP